MITQEEKKEIEELEIKMREIEIKEKGFSNIPLRSPYWDYRKQVQKLKLKDGPTES